MADAEKIIERLRNVESMKQSSIQHQVNNILFTLFVYLLYFIVFYCILLNSLNFRFFN